MPTDLELVRMLLARIIHLFNVLLTSLINHCFVTITSCNNVIHGPQNE